MKKIKRILTVLILCVLCLTLTGCVDLSEMRANHGFWLTEEHSSFELDGTVYQKLPDCDTLHPLKDNGTLTKIYVTDADIPLLLCELYSSEFYTDDDRNFIDYSNGIYYCKSELYDEMYKKITEGVSMSECRFGLYNYETYEYEYSYLNDEQAFAITLVLDETEPTVHHNSVNINYDYSIDIERCSEDKLFSEYACEILVSDNSYHLSKYVGDTVLVYEIPKQLYSVYEKITSQYLDKEYNLEDTVSWEEFNNENIIVEA